MTVVLEACSRRVRRRRALGLHSSPAPRSCGDERANWLQLALVVVISTTPLLGAVPGARARRRGRAGRPRLPPVERAIYRLLGVDPSREQRWTVYALSLLAFSAVSVFGLYLLQRVQGALPLNPTDVAGVPPALAFNTAASFVTNTNWQNYGGESTMSHLTQMAGLAVQNFVSAAVGISVAVALVRGLVRRRSATIGNFWVDLTRIDDARAPAALRRGRARSSRARASSRAFAGRRAQTVEGAAQSIYRGAGREPGGDQGARHERRRDRERELGAPVREPDRVHEPCRDAGRSSRSRSRSRSRSAGSSATAARAGRCSRRCSCSGSRSAGLATGFELDGNPRVDAGARPEHGGQGGAVRRSRLRALRRHDDRDLDGRGDRGPRQLHAARRRRPAREHDARRGLARAASAPASTGC